MDTDGTDQICSCNDNWDCICEVDQRNHYRDTVDAVGLDRQRCRPNVVAMVVVDRRCVESICYSFC